MSNYTIALAILLIAGAGALFEGIIAILYVIEVAVFSLQAKTIIEGIFMGVGVIGGLVFVGIKMNQMSSSYEHVSDNRGASASEKHHAKKDAKNIYPIALTSMVLFFGFGLLFLGRVWWLYNTDYIPTDDLTTFVGYPLPTSPTNTELTNRIVIGLEDAIGFAMALLLLYSVSEGLKCLYNPESDDVYLDANGRVIRNL